MRTALEKTRLTLNRMGITTPWWPAAEEETQDLKAPTAPKPSARKVRSLSESISAAPAPVASTAAVTSSDTPQPAVANTQTDEVAPFSVLVGFSESGWLAVSVIAGQHERVPAAQAGLVQDLLQAITAKPAALASQEVMSWPPKGSQRRATLAEAKDMLHGCVQRWCSQQPVQDVLLIGDQVIDWLGIEMGSKPLASQFVDSLGQRCLALPGWPDQLDADAKRALWRLIAALKGTA